tara:strand:- start:17114 stop:19168 length:2055 start_codon:yes stop_codon:yes gene_type:complete
MKELITLDTECYPNYWLFAAKSLNTGKVIKAECFGENSKLSFSDIKTIKTILYTRTCFGFNSLNYDIPIIAYALMGKTCQQLYELSNDIIVNNKRIWQVSNEYDLNIDRRLNHFDIMEPSPGVKVGLKLYGGRIHSNKLQDLPIMPGMQLSKKDATDVSLYCENDLNTNIDLYYQIEDRISIRFDMSKKYKIDVRSKSDAQIAEAIIKYELEKLSNSKIYKPIIPENTTYKYKAPNYIKFKSEKLNNILSFVESHRFELDGKGSIKLPKELSINKIEIGSSKYKMGIGGLHSSEKSQTTIPNSNEILVDRDVEAFYPNIILSLGLYPKMLGKKFLNIYKNIVDERMYAKHKCKELDPEHKDFEKYDISNKVNKIVINGSFGKLGSRYSILYAPDLMLKVTMTGQLALLMLIERLEDANMHVKSANTDGFVSLMSIHQYELYDSICMDWELDTGFILEETKYKALYSRDVNNYLAITTDNKTKGKGIFTLNQLSKNPSGDIIIKAVMNFLTNNSPIEKTIRECKDIKKFIIVRSVTGGAKWKNNYLGKVVRWIYSTEGDTIYYYKNKQIYFSDGIGGENLGNKKPKMQILKNADMEELDWHTDNINYKFKEEALSKNINVSKESRTIYGYAYSELLGETIFLIEGNKVPKSDKAYPIMHLMDLPDHIDYEQYIFEANSILKDLGI